MKRLYCFLILVSFSFVLFSQGLNNDGANIVITSGTTVFIDGGSDGDFVNANGGEVDIDGVLQLEGDFTNNAANNVFINVDNDGEVIFSGTNQAITAAIANYVDFEKLTINGSSTTTLNAASALTANGTFTINGTFVSETPSDEGPGGSIITETGGGTVTGTGTLTIKRFFKVNNRWQYISVPMTGQQSDIFTEDTYSGNFNPNLYTYNETFDASPDPNNTNYSNYDYGSGYGFWQAWEQVQAAAGAPVALNPAIGYITYNENDITAEFTTSTPANINNDGTYSPALSYTLNDNGAGAGDFYDGWNLIGNPYPCALDWDDAGWTKTNITNTVYMWDGDNGNYIYYNDGTPNDFVQGVGQTLNSDANARYIPPMQSFMVKADAAAPSITIPASARIHSSNDMYKKDNQKPTFDYVKLQFEHNGNTDQTLVRFFESSEVTYKFDQKVDAYKAFAVNNPQMPQVYSIISENNVTLPLAINSMPVKENLKSEIIPLGVVAKETGEYTFTAPEINMNFLDNIYLIDQTNGNSTYTDLSLTPSYTTYIREGENKSRFYLLAYYSYTDIENDINNVSDAKIYAYNKTVYLTLNDIEDAHGKVRIFDAIGRLVFSDIVNSTFNEYDLNNVASGTYLVKYKSSKKLLTRKVVLK